MKIVVIGGGEIGKAIAESLCLENHDICIIEEKKEIAKKLNDSLEARVIEGSGCSPRILKMAGVPEADIITIVTDSDEDNLCASMLCRYLAPEAKIIARIRNPELASERDFLMKSGPKLSQILNPEILAAKQIFHAIKVPSALEVSEFENEKLLMIGIKIPEDTPVTGHTMKELPQILNKRILFVARYRNGDFIIPKGDSDIKANDILYFASKTDDVNIIATSIGLKWTEIKDAVIFGGSITGIHLASLLVKSGISVKLVEKDHQVASTVTELLPQVLVLEWEPTDTALWKEENLGSCDVLVAASKEEDLNLMVALMGKNMGIKHTAVVTYKSDFIPVLLASGITTVVSPRIAAIGSVLKYLRKGKILQVAPTEHQDGQMLEYEIKSGDTIEGKKIRDIPFPKRAIIAAIIRHGEVIIPTGTTEITSGDRILVFARNKALPDLEKLMQG